MNSLLSHARTGSAALAVSCLIVGGGFIGVSSASAAELPPAAASAAGLQSAGIGIATANLDSAAQSDLLRVTSPISNSTASSRTITFSGTAPAGSTVRIDTNATAYHRPDVIVGASGTWSITTTFETGTPQNTALTTASAMFSGQDADGTPFVPQSVTGIVLPDPQPTPVITGISVDGGAATVTGTATGGPAVAVFFSAVDAAAQAAANNMPGSIEMTGVVGATGTFSVTETLPAGQWSASAVLLATTDVHTAGYLSLMSTGRQFMSNVASDPVAPASTVTAPNTASSTSAGQLADTGSSPLGGMLAGGIAILGGLALLAFRRRPATMR
jgi:LPXTG-motif cell wall-anchored protein